VADSAPLVPGAALATEVAYRRGPLRPGAWLSAEYRLPFDIDRSPLAPRAQMVSLRALPSLDLYQRRPWILGVALGGGIDVFRVDHGVEQSGEPPTRLSATRANPVLAGFLVARLVLVQNVCLTSFWGVEFDLDRQDLEVRQDRHRDAGPWPVRPGVMLGIGFTPLGPDPFGG
jgi:hypothetical protein